MITVLCDEPCRVRVAGWLESGTGPRKPVFRVEGNAGPTAPAELTVTLSRSERRAAVRRLRRGGAVRLNIRAEAADAAGNARTSGLRLRLRK